MKQRLKRLLGWLCLVLLLSALGIALWVYMAYRRENPRTDDAYVHAHIVRMASQLSGTIKVLPVQALQNVRRGQLLLLIDPEPYQLALKQAETQLAQSLDANKVKQQQAAQAELQVVQRASEAKLAAQQLQRVRVLLGRGMVSQSQADAAQNQSVVAKAALSAAKHHLAMARSALGGVGDQDPAVRKARLAVVRAKLDLSHTQIHAPTDGQIADLHLRVGATVRAGEPLFALVETGRWWVLAHYKETQMASIRVGERASVQVDMLPGVTFKGVVSAISRGSGNSFSLLPAENATGNWVKVTQRFPVRIALVSPAGAQARLRDGASAEVVVNTGQHLTWIQPRWWSSQHQTAPSVQTAST